MPTGPKGEKRPADVIGNAVHVMRIATGEIEETIPDDGKDPAAKALGKKGGAARAKAMTPERRAEIAQKALIKRPRRLRRKYASATINFQLHACPSCGL
jgi:hypothetical protein